jgi:hypothetical protein
MPGCCPRIPAVNPFDPFSNARRMKERIAKKLEQSTANEMIDLSEEIGKDVDVKQSNE